MIAPLKGPNYATWKVQCMMALKKDEVWKIVNGTEQAPADDADARQLECYGVCDALRCSGPHACCTDQASEPVPREARQSVSHYCPLS